MRGLLARYVDGLAADSGLWAFVKWFLIATALHVVVGLAIGIPWVLATLLVSSVPASEDARFGAVIGLLLLGLLFVRASCCALPCWLAGPRKGLGPAWLWGGLGLVLGQLAVGLLGALRARRP